MVWRDQRLNPGLLDNWRTLYTVLKKNIPLTVFERATKGFVCERWVGYWTELQHIDPAQLFWLQQHFFPVLLGCSTGGMEAQLLLGHGSHSSIFSPTNWLPVAPGLYNYLTPTCFLWRHNLHSVQPIDSQGYPPISLTGCTCYLHRCISHLTARPGRRSICYHNLLRYKTMWLSSSQSHKTVFQQNNENFLVMLHKVKMIHISITTVFLIIQ